MILSGCWACIASTSVQAYQMLTSIHCALTLIACPMTSSALPPAYTSALSKLQQRWCHYHVCTNLSSTRPPRQVFALLRHEVYLQVHPSISADSHQLLGLYTTTHEVMRACIRLQSTKISVFEMTGVAYLLDIYLSAERYPSSITQGADLHN